MDCVIYKGDKKPGSFLYIEKEDDFERVPEALLAMMGEREVVMSLDLGQYDKLANADIELVKQSLHEKGYYLQLPPEQDEEELAFE